jgi:hypothetical protein
MQHNSKQNCISFRNSNTRLKRKKGLKQGGGGKGAGNEVTEKGIKAEFFTI